jgi:type VI secretion system protein VasD
MKSSEGASLRRPRRAFVALGLTSLALLTGAVLVPAACVTIPPQKPDPCNVQIVTLRIYADELINPNEEERTRPVMVRLYQLKSDQKIVNARYEELLDKDKEILGDTLMKVDEIKSVFPNDLYEVKFERIPEASILAGVAFFRSPIGQSYKTYYEFPPMPNTPEACGQEGAGGKDEKEKNKPQAFPSTEFFIRERKIDNGSEFDPSMFPKATKFKKIVLPRASAGKDSQQAPSLAPPPAPK